MSEEIIGMDDMMAIYEVTDRFGIDRESIGVPLEKDGDGAVRRESGGGSRDHGAGDDVDAGVASYASGRAGAARVRSE